MKPKVNLKIVPLNENDCDDVIVFFQKYFFPDEPLNQSLKRCPTPEECPFSKFLKDELSMKMIDTLANTENNICGMVLNKELSLAKYLKGIQEPIDCPKKNKIHKLLHELNDRSEIWKKVNNENHLNICCVVVNSDYRGLNIGRTLMEESLKLGQSLGLKYATVECTSYYSAKLAEALGFELLYEIPYDQYLDESGEPVFKVQKPHIAAKKFIKTLN